MDIATLITKILTSVAFDFMRCDRVEIGCNKANVKSKKVIEKCQFILEGEIRNYFTNPTSEMLNNRYSSERTFLLYGLVVEDLSELSRYLEIKKHIKIVC
ncbi:putative uncharacterized protein [Parachlamydia acanthamoebae UV-7]|uniref:Uncharacterized protein n=2 Tax=Parachlamydia acanthamoebae TaxID=83552 RepID=F8L001_PARAV|nr:GNAT family protein [Parachlamydia acanthamoebae]KIA77809.1 hypothetical protein DB43_FS00500 [Parachlamydia acanthamoebae]CCB86511.1 putative uncharacterized protein [Parachlamydia acanthamoebae UV-7]